MNPTSSNRPICQPTRTGDQIGMGPKTKVEALPFLRLVHPLRPQVPSVLRKLPVFQAQPERSLGPSHVF